MPLWGGLAVADALRDRCGVDASLKWPNDVLVGEQKVCGLLAEAVGDAVVLGIGLNVTTTRRRAAARPRDVAAAGRRRPPPTATPCCGRCCAASARRSRPPTGTPTGPAAARSAGASGSSCRAASRRGHRHRVDDNGRLVVDGVAARRGRRRPPAPARTCRPGRGPPRKLLGEGEEVVLDLHPHGKRLVLPLLVLLLCAAASGVALAQVDDGRVLLAIGVVALLLVLWRSVVPFLRWRSTLFLVTDPPRRRAQGVLRRSGRDVPLTRVNDVTFSHGLVDRLLGCGTLDRRVGRRARPGGADRAAARRAGAAHALRWPTPARPRPTTTSPEVQGDALEEALLGAPST